MSEQEKLIAAIQDATDCEILEFDFSEVYKFLREHECQQYKIAKLSGGVLMNKSTEAFLVTLAFMVGTTLIHVLAGTTETVHQTGILFMLLYYAVRGDIK